MFSSPPPAIMPAVAAEDVQYSLLSTARYDDALRNVAWNTRVNGGDPSAYMLLPYHFDRLLAAAEDHGWMASRQHMQYADLVAACNDNVQAALTQHGHGPLRVSSPVLLCFPPLINSQLRILFSLEGAFTVTATPLSTPAGFVIPALPQASDVVRLIYIDPERTTPSIFTTTKTTHRQVYNAARARHNLAPIPTPSDVHIDVLLHNDDDLVMETSIRNIAFLRNNQWITPSTTSGCLPGVMRRLMLEENHFTEGDIKLSEVVVGEIVLTVNGVEGVQYAKIAAFPLAEGQ